MSLLFSGVIAALIAGGGIAHAEPTTEAVPIPAVPSLGSPYGTVTLPTGDQIRLAPDGTTQFRPAPGRESLPFFTWPGDDVILIPADVVAGLADGTEDLRRYNVSALLAAGITDPSTVAASALPGEPYVAYERSAAAPVLDITLRDRDGVAPDASKVLWIDMDGDDFGLIDIDENGVGSQALPPGDYMLSVEVVSLVKGDARGDVTVALQKVTVDDDGAAVVVDAADGRPVTVQVDQPDAVQLTSEISLAAKIGADDYEVGGGLAEGYDGYIIPVDIPDARTGMLYRPVLSSPEGAADPYIYRLMFSEADGIPDDPTYRVSDEDLAIVDTDYPSLGTDVAGDACDGIYPEWPLGMGAICVLVDIEVPSQLVNYYTPGDWNRSYSVGTPEEGYSAWTAETTLSVGRTEAGFDSGPLSVGESSYARLSGEGMGGWGNFGAVERDDLSLTNFGYTGSVVISRDGEELGREEGFIDQGCHIVIPDESGRYTLTVTGDRDTPYTPLAVNTEMVWTFDSDPVEEFEYLPLPHVSFTADGISDGYADRSAVLPIALELKSPQGLPQTGLVTLSLEVSFDDGDSWTAVALDRDGNAATGDLELPAEGDFASVRVSGTDDAGVEFSHTTIRSFGLD
ncbi:hypothetical protein FB566_2085 [Stackebrandtia endophytica]|uniref:Ig-like domain-containing protein n=1 Tax=Stackebrandtia endophytica TaxID=1496996 RepID=A0A543AVD8_9ACTN|nr:hypothetical protein [Stackebrandtia endophytica]TQL76553.1 hypothetical protein FB566_2085 [Stackebrandtia endophytica]